VVRSLFDKTPFITVETVSWTRRIRYRADPWAILCDGSDEKNSITSSLVIKLGRLGRFRTLFTAWDNTARRPKKISLQNRTFHFAI